MTKCKSQSCIYMCCDINGYCPSNLSQCVYYYDNQLVSLSPGIIVGISIAAVCVLLIISLVICYFFKKWKRNRDQYQQNNAPSHPNPIQLQRSQPLNGNNTFQNLILAQNRQPQQLISSNNQQILGNIPQPYFQNDQPQNNVNPYYHS